MIEKFQNQNSPDTTIRLIGTSDTYSVFDEKELLSYEYPFLTGENKDVLIERIN